MDQVPVDIDQGGLAGRLADQVRVPDLPVHRLGCQTPNGIARDVFESSGSARRTPSKTEELGRPGCLQEQGQYQRSIWNNGGVL